MEFSHIPVMLNECIEGLNIKPNGTYIDGTLGGAGHSSEILKRLTSGKLIAIDKDTDAINASREKLSKISSNFEIVHNDFNNIKSILDQLRIEKVDGILLDLGVSSYQVDNPERGFSYRYDSKLDMRMDKDQHFTAYEVVNGYTEERLIKILYEYGDESFAKKIVRNIITARKTKPIETTSELVELIERAYPSKILHKGGSVAKKTFQAIRIEVNGELNRLENTLSDMIDSLNEGGRLCVITFHSAEDKIVKHLFKDKAIKCICPKEAIKCTCNHKPDVKLITRKSITASEEELATNKRSHSAKLRIVEKL